MIDGGEHKRKTAVNALLKIALWEGLVLIAVVASYIATGSLAVLIAGIVDRRHCSRPCCCVGSATMVKR